MEPQFESRLPDYWPTIQTPRLTPDQVEYYRAEIKRLLQERNAALIAHYYVDAEIQRLAEDTGGIVADSLEMARFGARSPATTLMICGVSFMGETAKILSPEKTVLMPTRQATCSLDISCKPNEFSQFIRDNPGRLVVVYANTSAAVKAMADWVVTSSNAVAIIEHLQEQGHRFIWAPDQYLGRYIQEKTNADMLIWQGSCIVHEEFKANALKDLKRKHPEAAVLVHPESPAEVIALADAVGSTSQLLKASQTLSHSTFIVATDNGIFYKMKQASPEKTFIEAPTGGTGATCRSCAHCPWMAMNSLVLLYESLKTNSNEITIPPEIRAKALISLERMVEFPLKS